MLVLQKLKDAAKLNLKQVFIVGLLFFALGSPLIYALWQNIVFEVGNTHFIGDLCIKELKSPDIASDISTLPKQQSTLEHNSHQEAL